MLDLASNRLVVLVAVAGVCAGAPARGQVAVAPALVDFGVVALGKSAKQAVAVRNNGPGLVSITQFDLIDQAMCGCVSTSLTMNGQMVALPLQLKPGGVLAFDVLFQPQSPGPISTEIDLTVDAPGQRFIHLPIIGAGPGAPSFRVKPAALDFGVLAGVAATPQNVVVTNPLASGVPVTLQSVTVSGQNAGDFFVPSLGSFVVDPGETVEVPVLFRPQARGPVESTSVATLQIQADRLAPATVSLVGKSVVETLMVSVGSPFDFGEVSVGQASAPILVGLRSGAFTGALHIIGYRSSTPGFGIDWTGTATSLAPVQSNQFRIIFVPPGTGPFSTTYAIEVDNGTTVTFDARGTGVKTQVSTLTTSGCAVGGVGGAPGSPASAVVMALLGAHLVVRRRARSLALAASILLVGCSSPTTSYVCQPSCGPGMVCTADGCAPPRTYDFAFPYGDLGAGPCGACAGVTPFCNAHQLCVACLTDSDCPAGRRCEVVDEASACVVGCGDAGNCAATDAGAPTLCCGGQCVDTTLDARNCGGCGAACTGLAHAAPACVASVCSLGSCLTGYADCNHQPADGCETSVESDVDNCGACGKRCQLPHATAGCAGGCYLAACDFLWDDCNGDPSDGCETSTLSDARNCGSCGNACRPGQVCENANCR